ncbi:hypothetical protein [Ilumatobacter sp.]|uniref:hypothetical protein n=1 Tax=Ilumatobacter sp. TaxID=1967498 RepID=UPI003B521817
MTEQAEIERRYFGTGPLVENASPDSIGIDIVFEDGPAGRELATQSGAANLAQDLKVALLTPTGNDMFNVGFGFDGLRVLSADMTPTMTTEMLRLAVLKTIALDNRIKRVLDVRIEETEPGSRRWMTEIEVQTVIGDVQRLVLGAVEGTPS